MQEQITRRVSKIGNGAHIFVPKKWINEEIVLVRTVKQDIKERILELLAPYLEDIIGVFLYGSYARNEQIKDSDVDILIISNKNFKIEKKDDFEIIILEEDKINKAIKINPLLVYSILNEAKPIINSNLLEELKEKYKPKIKDFKEMIEDTKRLVKINKEFLDLEEEKYTDDKATAYSLILRLRGIYLINLLLDGKSYNYNDFKKWVQSNTQLKDYDSIYKAYLSIKREIKLKQKILVLDLNNLLKLLEKETLKLEGKYGKKKKTS